MTRDCFTLAVASGKGGTGKTLVATSLAAMEARAGKEVVLVDCDVEAPNDHLFLPWTASRETLVHVQQAVVDPTRCTGCGTCGDACAYGAPRLLGPTTLVFPELCHGCGLCVAVCPTGAMTEVPHSVGRVREGPTSIDGLTLVSGSLTVGEVRAPSIIKEARRRVGDRADLVILDAPPG